MSKLPSSSSMRSPNSPRIQSRQTSIVEMLSSPPPLDASDPHNLPAGSSDGSNSSLAQAMAAGSQPTFNSPLGSNSGQPLTAQQLQNLQQQQQQQSLYTGLSRNSSMSSSILAGTAIDWQETPLSELVEKSKLIIIRDKLSVEEAFETLSKHGLTSVPVEQYENDPNCLTFDYADLNAYLLLVLNKLNPDSLTNMNYEPKEDIPVLTRKAQRGEQVPVAFVIRMSTKNPFIKLSEADNLSTVVEILGTGVHRVAITKDNKLTGVLSQRRLVKWLWDNARRFPSMEPLLTSSLQHLQIGSPNPVSIFGDQLLIEAFMKMNSLKVSSLAVIDRNYHLLGNISVTDVRIVSKSSRSDLLYKTCLHFISVILNLRGLENGQDSFPIFHVTTSSSLARTIAKLVATKSHRLWIVKPDNPVPQQSAAGSNTPLSPAGTGSSYDRHSSISGTPLMQSNSFSSEMAAANAAAVSQDKERSNGKLVGVISLTDILSLFARTLGKDHVDPSIARKQRRRSSSSGSSSSRMSSVSGSLADYRKSISDSAGRPGNN